MAETVKLPITILGTFVALLGPAAATAAPTTIAVLNGPTTVEYYGGVEAWSDYNPASRSWDVVVRRNGQISTPSIPTAEKAIQVDVGPGPSGVPMLAYISCAGACHLVVSGVDGSDLQTVPHSDGASHPTIWGDQVAWVAGKTKVITSRLEGSDRKVLAGTPRRKCYYPGNEVGNANPPIVCAAPEAPRVEALQLYRSKLALIDSYRLPVPYEQEQEVRTENIAGGPQHLVAIINIGIGEESFVGPSWSNGKLYFYEDATDGAVKVYRFNPANDTYSITPAYAYLDGFSVIGERAYETTGSTLNYAPGTCQREEPCVLRLSEPFAFKPTGAPIAIP